MPDHVHEVEVSGDVIVSGPPIQQAGEVPEDPAAAELAEEMGLTPVKRKASVDLGAVEADEARQVTAAGDDPSKLPDYAKAIWKRMFHSGKAYSGDASYAAMVAWRAVRKRYGLAAAGAEKRTPTQGTKRTKSTFAGTLIREDSSSYVVRITDEDPTKYQTHQRVDLDAVPGVAAMVGMLAGNRRSITSVIVPKRLVSTEPPGGAGAIKWVRRYWPWIWKHSMGEMGMMRTVAAKRSPLAGRRYELKRFHGGSAFVSDPRRATKRIAYGEVYRPFWVDHQGDYATEVQVEEFAHRFMKTGGVPGLMHAAWPVGDIVESFIARRGDPDFVAGSWVGATEYAPEVWAKILTRELTGYSMGGRWNSEAVTGAA